MQEIFSAKLCLIVNLKFSLHAAKNKTLTTKCVCTEQKSKHILHSLCIQYIYINVLCFQIYRSQSHPVPQLICIWVLCGAFWEPVYLLHSTGLDRQTTIMSTGTTDSCLIPTWYFKPKIVTQAKNCIIIYYCVPLVHHASRH